VRNIRRILTGNSGRYTAQGSISLLYHNLEFLLTKNPEENKSSYPSPRCFSL
jgi:hypothetical protein